MGLALSFFLSPLPLSLAWADGVSEACGCTGTVAPSAGALAPGTDGEVVAVAHGPGTWLVHATVRNRSCACRFTRSTSSLSVLPGTSTTMYLLPCVVTSASETPLALTRWSMMSAASVRLSLVTSLPEAVSVIRVPPSRSSPSAGFQVPPMATRPKMIATAMKNTTRVRPGRAVLRAMSVLLRAVDDGALVLVGVGADRPNRSAARPGW